VHPLRAGRLLTTGNFTNLGSISPGLKAQTREIQALKSEFDHENTLQANSRPKISRS
jgi:hypothetical protein